MRLVKGTPGRTRNANRELPASSVRNHGCLQGISELGVSLGFVRQASSPDVEQVEHLDLDEVGRRWGRRRTTSRRCTRRGPSHTSLRATTSVTETRVALVDTGSTLVSLAGIVGLELHIVDSWQAHE